MARISTRDVADGGDGHLVDDRANLGGRVGVVPEIQVDLQVGEERRRPVVAHEDVEELFEPTFERRTVDRARLGKLRELTLAVFEDREQQALACTEVVLDHTPTHTGATRAISFELAR